jgi:hypothetical protein
MSATADFAAGNYRFIPAVFQYSSGVAALPGYEIRRVQFKTPIPLEQGFARVERFITGAGRPLTSFCACELRSPAPFTDAGFLAFNKVYAVTLQKWGLFDGTTNPVARSNVCPAIDPPAEPSFHAFSFTVPTTDSRPTFVIAGSGELRTGRGSYKELTVRYGETGPDAMLEKARVVLTEMERRLALFGLTWSDTTATQLYTVQNIYSFLGDEIVRRGAARSGLTWHFNRPPVQGLEYEMDCRRVNWEAILG